MINKNKLFLYNKLFKFKYFFSNLNIFLKKKNIINFIKIFRLLINIKNFGVFIPEILNFSNPWIFSFWKKGFISNFRILRWFFLKKFFLKNLPIFLINLTSNNNISLEIQKKNIPFINLLTTVSYKKNKNIGDYFLLNNNTFNLDNIFFFIKIFSFLKKYKNV